MRAKGCAKPLGRSGHARLVGRRMMIQSQPVASQEPCSLIFPLPRAPTPPSSPNDGSRPPALHGVQGKRDGIVESPPRNYRTLYPRGNAVRRSKWPSFHVRKVPSDSLWGAEELFPVHHSRVNACVDRQEYYILRIGDVGFVN